MKPYFPAYTQFASVTDSHDPYFIIDHPVKGTSVKIKLSDLTPKLMAAMLTEMGDRPNRVLRTNSDGDLVLSSYPIAFGTAAGTDTYTVTLNPVIDAIDTGVPFLVKFGITNTGAATLNLNGLGAKSLVKDASTALVAGDIVVDKYYVGVYDGTNIQLTNMTTAPASEWTSATVNISAAQILAMGSTPIELLPAPAANTYYEIENIRLEFDYGTVQYQSTTATHLVINDQGRVPSQTISVIKAFGGGGLIGGNDNTVVVLKPQSQSYYDAVNTFTFAEATSLGTGNVSLGTNDNDNPILGDGTMRAIIRYKVRTFGA